MFPDLDHFDRQNYTFEFVRWEVLGDVRCAEIDVKPRENSVNRGFVGRIWVEDQDFNIVRFTGTYASKALSKRAFHFDSWRLNTLSIMWMPAFVYTEESDPHDPSSHGLWFKAQTRIWGYDLEHAGDHREFAKPLTDTPAWVDPKRHEASQDLSPAYTLGKTTYTAEDEVVERLQVAGLMAPDGEVNQILQTVTNNLLVTNDLDIAGVRCRVLLTMPLESFVVGRTIVLSRGLLDVLPDEATLAAVLAHELAHIVLRHPSVTDTWRASACRSRIWRSLPTLTSVSIPRRRPRPTRKAWSCLRSRPIKTSSRMLHSSWKLWKPALRNCRTCCMGASATISGAVIWSECRRWPTLRSICKWIGWIRSPPCRSARASRSIPGLTGLR